MSLISHLAVFGLLVVDLIFGSPTVVRVAGRWVTIGFEFALILGYVLFAVQVIPWRRSGRDS